MLTFKKTISIIIICFTVLSGVCCSKPVKQLTDPADMYSYVLQNGEFPEMADIDSETLGEVYGIDAAKLDKYVLRKSTEKNLADEVGIFKLSDVSYGEKLVRVLKAHIGSFARQAEGYNKDQYLIIKNTEVFAKNGYVFFIINKDGAELANRLSSMIPGSNADK